MKFRSRSASDGGFSAFAPYRSVRALLITWEDAAEKEFAEQREALAKEFKQHGFVVEEAFEIKSTRPHQSLIPRLQQFLANDRDGTLLILYYGGHGMNNEDKDHIWLWYDFRETPTNQSNSHIT
jgi:hypothetical protein